ncbi:DUF5808 domain-containing protein [Paenibacillus sp. Soil522]|uniref:DUF5808 domain-containing protein n=1 Tax=Paenibacillus sp. Soil522 TaxID=1736388 RepID=UPI0006F75B4F|nr:DUF5808 domain-containing protein [Paenibacillus sp. Soil522]KRE35426.1 hypothetical protein ASG81_21075 [Paenibacillus sp. Soil522]
MNNLFLIIPAVIAYIFILLMFLKQAKPSNHILFGVILPAHALEDASIKQLQSEYKKLYTIYGFITLITLTPFFLLGQYFSLALMYMFLWFAAFLYTSKLPFNKIHHKATALKRENEWFVGEKRIIRIDTKVALLKKSKLASPYWFLIPALLSVVPILLSFKNTDVLLKMTGFASLAMTVILYVIYSAFGKMKTKVYSENTDINAAIDCAARRYWSILWPILAAFESINALVAYMILTKGSILSFTQWIIGIVMVSLVPLGSIFFVHNKVRALEESLAETDGKGIPTDDDGYWINGSTYFNPNDKAVMVSRRIGIGTTVNMATRGGKWIQYGGIVLAIAVIIPLAAFAAQSDHTSPALTIEERGIVSIDYPLYDYSFNMSNVKEIKLEAELPSGFRTNGMATSEYARGNFSLEKLGASKLYVFKNSPPYIFIQLDDLYVIFNEKDTAKTKALFTELTARKSK